MALGYENTGIGPKLISHAGDVMTESIRRIGEKIQGDIVQHRTDKEVAGFLGEAKNLNIESPTFQADLVGTLAKYPMAAADQRALMGAKLLVTGWEQKQAQKEAVTRFNERKTLAGMRNTGGGLYGGGNFDLPALPTSGEDAAFDAGGQVLGAMSPLGVPFNPQTEIPADEANPLFNQDLDQTFRKIGVDRRTGTRLMAQDAAARARATEKPILRNIPGVGVGVWNPETKTLDVAAEGKRPEKWLNLGDKWQNVQTGEEKPIEISPAQQESINIRKAAAETQKAATTARTQSAEATRAIRAIEDRKNVIEKDRAEKIKTIESFERDGKKAPAENYEVLKQLNSQLKTHNDLIDEIRGEKDVEKAAYNSAEAVRAAFKAGELTREKALRILRQDFGL